MSLRISIVDCTNSVNTVRLKRQLSRCATQLRTPLRELSVALVDARTSSRLHRRFLGISAATDVLTFPLETAGRPPRAISGEVVVCVPVARRRAAASGICDADEMLLYALHGLLHLSGYDDATAKGFRRMHRAEDHILKSIGVGAVFQPPTAASAARRPKAKKPRRPPPNRRGHP
jgi:probable rRNA maturation factor